MAIRFLLLPIGYWLVASGYLNAQQLQPGLNESLNFEVRFNPSFIKSNKIKGLVRHISEKPDNQLITDRGLCERIEFDSLGRTVSAYMTVISGSSVKEIPGNSYTYRGKHYTGTKSEVSYAYDTAFRYYRYDSLSRLTVKRSSVSGRDVFKSFYFEYDSTGNLQKLTSVKEINNSQSHDRFSPGMQDVLFSESYTYQTLSLGQVKKKFYNDEGRVYKEGIMHKDNMGHITEETFDYTVTWIKERNTYKFNDKGVISEKTLSSNEGIAENESYQYEFDASGMLVAMRLFRRGIKSNEINYLYDKKSGMVQSEINRDFPHSSISIIRYEYLY